MDYIIQGGQLLLSISILVVLHEGGHFFAAKLFKTKVESFYLFFNPWFSVYKKKIGETEYGIGWLPLGGYVKIAGMIDESMDKEQMKQPPQPWEFRAKPTWQRLIIMLGGIIVNVIVGFLIYSFVLMGYGEKFLPASELKDGVWCLNEPITNEIGLQNGDKIISINGEIPATFEQMQEEIFYSKTLVVERNGEQLTLDIPVDLINKLLEERRGPLFVYRIPFTVGEVEKDLPAEKAGLKPKDKIIGINDIEINYFDEFKATLTQYINQTIDLKIKRGEEILILPVSIGDSAIIGVKRYAYSLTELEKEGIYNTKTVHYSFFASFPRGVEIAKEKLVNYYKQFKLMLNPETGAYKAMGGFATISKLFGTEWVWQNFWEKTAWISLVLAFMNLLPIPALDGGHVMFLLYEMITGRKPNEKIMEYAQVAGMVLLLLLMIYANTDIFRF
jgi:regulator of sigma E protease